MPVFLENFVEIPRHVAYETSRLVHVLAHAVKQALLLLSFLLNVNRDSFQSGRSVCYLVYRPVVLALLASGLVPWREHPSRIDCSFGIRDSAAVAMPATEV